MWRLVSSVPISAPVSGNTTHLLARSYVRILATLERFLIDEGAHAELFAHIYEAAQVVQSTYADAKRFDTLAIWRIIALLGYIAIKDDMTDYASLPFHEALMMLDEATTKHMIATVNTTIKETHL